MNQLWFWKNWQANYRHLLFIISLLGIGSLGLFWFTSFISPAPAISTEQYQQLETQEVALHTFSIAGISLTTTGDSFLIFEQLKGGPFKLNQLTGYIYVGVLACAMIVLLSIITTLSRFWYFAGMGLFILFIVGFRLEAVALFNQSNKIPTMAVLVLYGGLSYYFASFNRTTNFQIRLISFALLTAAFLLCLIFFSPVKDPFQPLAANGMIAGVVLSIAFIFTVAHEILALFVNVISRGVKQTNSLRHFIIISVIYMINLSLTYAERKGFIHWNFLTVNLFLLLTVSAILGVWGFRQRERLYSNILSIAPLASYFFIALAAVCFATISFFLATANDPPLQLMKDTIMYAHLGYGLIFICYVFANFASMLADNLQVYKVLYNPNTMPYFTFRLAGLIATFAFFAYSTYSISVHQLFAGYYNANADVYSFEGDAQAAESYYGLSLNYSNRNHHAHYALASMQAQQLQLSKEKKHYELAEDTRPTELSYLNLSASQDRDGEELQANNTLLKGLSDFPESGKLLNALGLSYAKLDLQDSALLSMDKAKQSSSTRSLAETNLVGLMAKFKFAFPADSLTRLVGLNEKGAKTNALALASQQKIELAIDLPQAKDSVLTVYEATLLNNYILNRHEKIDTAFLHSIITLARKPSNKYYKASLLEAVSQAYYAVGEVQKAFNLLSENAFIDKSGKMYNTLGLWALEQGNAEIALAEFKYALDQKFEAGQFGKALSLSTLADEKGATSAWQELLTSSDTTFRSIAKSFLKIYSTSAKEVASLNDLQKYQYTYFRIPVLDTITFNKVIATIVDTDFKAKAILDRSKKLWRVDEPQAAANMISKLQDINLQNKITYNDVLHFNLQLLAALPDLPTLKQQLEGGIYFKDFEKTNKVYYEALLTVLSGNKEEAKNKYEWLSQNNPFNEDATLAGIKYVKQNSPDKLKAFNRLVNAISINPGSPKILKAYIVEAASLGFDDYAQESLDKLKEMISPSSFSKFIRENPTIFQVIPN